MRKNEVALLLSALFVLASSGVATAREAVYANTDIKGNGSSWTENQSNKDDFLLSDDKKSYTVSGYTDIRLTFSAKEGNDRTIIRTEKGSSIAIEADSFSAQGKSNGKNTPIVLHAYSGTIAIETQKDITLTTDNSNAIMSQATKDGGSSLVQLHSKQGSIRVTSDATTIAVGMLQQGLEGKTSQLEMKAKKDIYVGTTNKERDALNLYNSNIPPGSWVGDSGQGIVTMEAGENLIVEGGRFGIYQPLTEKNITASSTFTAGKSVQISGRGGLFAQSGPRMGKILCISTPQQLTCIQQVKPQKSIRTANK